MNKKLTPHIIAIIAIVVFIVLGLACASTGSPTSKTLEELFTKDKKNEIHFNSAIFIQDNQKIFINYDYDYAIYNASDGKLVHKGKNLAYGVYGHDFPEDNSFLIIGDGGIAKFNSDSYEILYTDRMGNEEIFPWFSSFSSQSVAFRFKSENFKGRINFHNIKSMRNTYITVDSEYDGSIGGYDDKNAKIILKKVDKGIIDVVDSNTGKILVNVKTPTNVMLSQDLSDLWGFRPVDNDGYH